MLVGVEPHVLRYWEREFRSIRPTKSAKGQRVYSRKDVENLLRVRDLLYRDGFTIAGAKKRLQRGPGHGLRQAAGRPSPDDAPLARANAPRAETRPRARRRRRMTMPRSPAASPRATREQSYPTDPREAHRAARGGRGIPPRARTSGARLNVRAVVVRPRAAARFHRSGDRGGAAIDRRS